ncbi:MAG: Nif11-like leader peptide family natural product precursor [Aliidongia sp.]
MSLNLAEQLIRRLATDPTFRQQLACLDGGAKRAFLDASGFRGVTSEWLQSIALDAFKDLTKGKDKVSEADAMSAVTAATTAAAATPGASAGFSADHRGNAGRESRRKRRPASSHRSPPLVSNRPPPPVSSRLSPPLRACIRRRAPVCSRLWRPRPACIRQPAPVCSKR